MNILVIGGTGTVGCHVVRGLLAKGEALPMTKQQ
jgi:nucleoside-diphosphate-sugar epimerase